MVIFCEECGERYVIEREDIKDSVITFSCRICKDIIEVTIPEEIRGKADNARGSAE
jgi:transcription elongation factor Elf1